MKKNRPFGEMPGSSNLYAGKNLFEPEKRRTEGFHLPQVISKWKHSLQDNRILVASMTLTNVQPSTFGKNLLCTYAFLATSTVTDRFIADLGYDSERLRQLDIVPDTITLSQSEVVKEFTSTSLEKSQRELFEKYKNWILKEDFSPRIFEEVRRAVKQGPDSRFSSHRTP